MLSARPGALDFRLISIHTLVLYSTISNYYSNINLLPPPPGTLEPQRFFGLFLASRRFSPSGFLWFIPHQHFVHILSPIAKFNLSLTQGRPTSSKTHCTFLGPTLFSPPPRSLSLPKKKDRDIQKIQKHHHDRAHRSPIYAPHEVTQDSPFEGHDNNPISHPPDKGFDDWSQADTARIVAMSGCNDDRLKSCIIAASASVWSVHEMYPAQLDAVYPLRHPMRPNHLAMIQRTGAGTHILRTLGVIEPGIILIFIPLLTLSADVMSKFTCANQNFGAIAIQHLDELFDANKRVYYDLLERCRGLLRSTTTTVFIFLSPQFLINHPEARGVFIECSHCTTLRVIALDGAHIHIQLGTSFRSKIRALQVLFFAKIFHEQSPMMRPQLIFLTAMMPNILPPTFV